MTPTPATPPTPTIRVLVVDDSPVMRRILASALGAEPRIRVVGTATNGRDGLAKIEELKPDVVTMDIEMPEMDGLTALTAARQRWPRLPIIMISSLTRSGAIATLEALGRGASDFVPKPDANGGDGIRRFGEDLCPRVVALARPTTIVRPRTEAPAPAPIPRSRGRSVRLIAIGASTGGPDALTRLLGGLHLPLPVPVVIVQHMPPVFTSMLAERLSAHCRARVVEATDGMVCAAGVVVIAPGDQHLELKTDGTTLFAHLTKGPPVNSCRPAVDVLFRSAAATAGAGTLAVILTGLGRDGCEGARALVAAGADVLAQDEASSVVWGMPGAVVKAGLARAVLPINELASLIQSRVGGGAGPIARRT